MGPKDAASAGLAGILCCVVPAVLFMFGLMGGIYAISFANFFTMRMGPQNWIMVIRVIAMIGAWSLPSKKQDQCSIDPDREEKFNSFELSNHLLV